MKRQPDAKVCEEALAYSLYGFRLLMSASDTFRAFDIHDRPLGIFSDEASDGPFVL